MTRLLLTNDDGVDAAGLRRLRDALREIVDEVVVVAPDREQSATSHSLTLHRPLRLHELGDDVFAVDGTPTDCVSLGVLWLLADRPPDLVVSGINDGLNLGDDVTYSGTVSASFEASLLGLPSVAISQETGEEPPPFERAARVARELVGALLAEPLDGRLLLNVNIPAGPIGGVSLSRLGRRSYRQAVVEKVDPRGRPYFWIAGTPEWQEEEGTDYAAVADGRISVTPLHLDLTDYPTLERGRALERRLSDCLSRCEIE